MLLPADGVAGLRTRLGRRAGRLPERLAADLARFEATDPAAAPAARAGAALDVGDAAEVWAGVLCPATALDHLDPGTLLVLDEPGDIADAAEFLWRQADERREDLEARRRPAEGLAVRRTCRRATGRPGCSRSRTLELTWESEAPGATRRSPAAG